MKVLFYEWSSYLQYDIRAILQEEGISFETFSWKFQDKNRDDEFEGWFAKTIQLSQYDAVLSINYWPMLSKMCQVYGVKYLAWCYDNPLNVQRIEETLSNVVNYVFLFDKVQYNMYKGEGIDTVYHMPLGVNKTRLKNLTISSHDWQKYSAEVSFVGSLYESRLYEMIAPLSDDIKEYINTLLGLQFKLYGSYVFDEMITEELIDAINAQYRLKKHDTKFSLNKEALTFAMASEVTRRDRMILLTLCGKRFCTKFYSYQDSDVITDVHKCPPVNYLEEMPKVFACSKINLNPSLRIIQTGVPLRAFDIMGSGGFLLSNYQEELLELYENEKDFVFYKSLQEAVEKIDFYLRREDVRKQITKNGRQKTLEEHTLQNRLEKILVIAGII